MREKTSSAASRSGNPASSCLPAAAIDVGDDVLSWHLPVLVGITALAAYFRYTGRLRRWQGCVLLMLYVAYWVVSFTMFGEVPVEAD
jgi:cation:H+ antiporter